MATTASRLARFGLLAAAGLVPAAAFAGVRIDLVPDACPAATPAPALEPLPPLPHLGLALGSGARHGIAHIGVLQELERAGVVPKVVAGTSVGALVGSLWASGIPAARIGELHALEDWEDMGSFAWSRAGIFSNERVRERLAAAFEGRAIEAWPLRFGAVATDIATGDRVLIARGDGALAVQASTAIPAYFLPVRFAGRDLVDGALVEPVPVDAARELGADFVLAVDVAYRPREERAITATQLAFQAMHVVTNALAAEQLKRADVAIVIDLHAVLMKCGRGALVAAGRAAVRSAWPAIAREAARRRGG
jgi:NTE family protein